jgi:hypothetical protein
MLQTMYRIIGADQREYGPVPAERVRRWIGEGRANAQTKARVDGWGEWKALGDFAEFGDLLVAQASVATPPPRVASAEADHMAEAIMARGQELDIGECFSRGWRLLQDNFWLLVGATAVVLLIGLGLGSVPLVGVIGLVLLGFVFLGGLDWVFLKRVRGQRADMADAFSGFSLAFVPLLLAGLVVQVLTVAGLILCILPGVYLFVIWWGFVPLLILDKKMDFWPAMELSRKVVHHQGWQVFGLMLAAAVVTIAGLLLFGVGVFLTLPLAIAAVVCAYEQIFNPPAANPVATEPVGPGGPPPTASPLSSEPDVPVTPPPPVMPAAAPQPGIPPVEPGSGPAENRASGTGA